MPNLPKEPKRPWIPEREKRPRTTTETNPFLNKAVWRKARKQYIRTQPFCEVSKAVGVYSEAQVVDHIIPRSFGGAKLDRRNLMSMTKTIHDLKSAYEQNKPLIDSYETKSGLIPVRKEDIINALIKKGVVKRGG